MARSDRESDGNVPVFVVEFAAMGSRCEVCLAACDEALARLYAAQAMDEIRRIEAKYSRYRSDSVVSRINAAAGREWVELDEESVALFNYADELYRISGGRFDITSGVLRRAWDFRYPKRPAPEALQPLLDLIGWRSVDWEPHAIPHRIRLPRAGMEIDFGGFGKEYAVDRAAVMLAGSGGKSGYVNLGGDVRIIGPRPDGRPWEISIRHPRAEDRTIASIPVSTGALATSGDYERFFELDGKRYCHILDPVSGQPVQAWQSVSVLAPLAVVAGSFSTVTMLMGDAGLDFLRRSNLAFLAIDQHGRIHRADPA